jgi:hypothetical protein
VAQPATRIHTARNDEGAGGIIETRGAMVEGESVLWH